MDFRLNWLRERILSFFGFEDNELFTNMLEANDNELHEKFMSFLNEPIYGSESTLNKIIFHVYRTYYDKLVQIEKEITEWRIIPPTVKLVTPPHSSKKKGKDKDKGKSKPKVKKEAEISTIDPETVIDDSLNDDTQENKLIAIIPEKSQMQAPELDPEVDGTVEYYTLKRFVPMMMKLPKLNGTFGEIKGNINPNLKIVYIIRLTETSIPIPNSDNDAKLIMPQHFYIGSIGGMFLKSILDVLKETYFQSLNIKSIESKLLTQPTFSNKKTDRRDKEFDRFSHYYQIAKSACKSTTEIRINHNKNSIKNTSPDQNVSISLEKDVNDMNRIHEKTPDDLNSLINSIEWTLEHTEAVLQLPVPNLSELNDTKIEIQVLSHDKDLIEVLEETVSKWCAQIATAVENSNSKNMEAEGPTDEFNFWKTNCNELSNLNEQLNIPIVLRIISILTHGNSPCLKSFELQKKNLHKKYHQAKENIEFLSTLLRHFKIITESSNFKIMTDTVPGMIDGLNMLWMLSEFYSRDENMVALLERIANCLCKKIEIHLSVKTLFLKSYDEVHQLAINAKYLMMKWKECYMITRKKIEFSGKGARWEFDRRRLFHRTDYLAGVCKDFSDISKVLIELQNIFGSELKSILKDHTEIEKIIFNMKQLVNPIQTIDFSLFMPDNKENWDVIVNDFYKEVLILENKSKQFIDNCFGNLKSSEEATTMLLKLIKYEIRESIHQQLTQKFDIIMKQFMNEITIIQDLFNEHKNNPPLLYNHPPIAGAIYWSRSLDKKLNKSILIFETISELENSEQKKIAFSYYKTLQQTMANYENDKLKNWIFASSDLINKFMKSNLLKVVDMNSTYFSSNQIGENMLKTFTKKHKSDSQDIAPSSNIIKNKNNKLKLSQLVNVRTLNKKNSKQASNNKQTNKKNWRDILENHLLCYYKLIYDPNFMHEIFEIINESEIMEYLGIDLPQSIRHCSMQKDRLHRQLQNIENIITEYNNHLTILTSFELKLLKSKLHSVERDFWPGLERITWISLSIEEFIENCNHSIESYKSIYKQLVIITKDINEKMCKIKNFNLFPPTMPQITNLQEYSSCKAFFENMKIIRTERIHEMIQIYESISPILIKLEYIILGTNTGHSDNMFDVYNYWEKNIFDMFTNCCIENLRCFCEALEKDSCLFQIDAILQIHNISMNPNNDELLNIIKDSINDFTMKFNMIVRWKKSSCLPYPVKEDNEKKSFSFYEDIIKVPDVIKLVSHIQEVAQTISKKANVYIQKWCEYDSLWTSEKILTCERFVKGNKDIINIDNKFVFYENIIENLKEHVDTMNIGCIQINLKPLISEIQNHALEWKNVLGKTLILYTRERMNGLHNVIKKFKNNLNTNIRGLDDFKLVMSTISFVKKLTMTSEIMYKSFQEIFYVLESHEIKIPREDIDFAYFLETSWHTLYLSCIFRYEKLEDTKEKFSKLTLFEIQQFSNEIIAFVEKFNMEGPGNVNNLDEGLLLMNEYIKIFDTIEEQRTILSSSEQLFDNPLADYHIFMQAKNDYICLEKIYDIYLRQKETQEIWSHIEWNDLNTEFLMNGIEDFLTEFGKLDDSTKEMKCAIILRTMLKQFKTIIPLMLSLKNEAIRERHWTDLMAETGHFFDISSKKLTLKNIFAMKLYEHIQTTETIINRALKEQYIERGIEEIKNIWASIKFTMSLNKISDIGDQTFTLDPCDKIMIILDDHFVNLQSMAASLFIGPFLPIVREWENKLSTISEIIEKWLIVQQKWLYLTNIFMRTDIKSLLPDETKNFILIDLEFREIMTKTNKILLVIECCTIPQIFEKLSTLSTKLDQCRKALTLYLDSIRYTFPRFFFIANDELVTILGSSNINNIQEYITKMFYNITSLHIDHDENNQFAATAMISTENEAMNFQKHITLKDCIAKWLKDVVHEMKSTNKAITKSAIFEYGKSGHLSKMDWIQKYQGMVCIVANAVWWTAETENVFDKIGRGFKSAMKEYLKNNNSQLSELLCEIQKEMSSNRWMKIKTLITFEIHNRDVVENFVKENISNIEDFHWESQLRFYWDKHTDDLEICQCIGNFKYGYEYMGLNNRIVISPLTDRIFLTITQALLMRFGGALFGPAGNGKTETIKDLAKTFALLCFVINCSETMDSQFLNNLFSGLCINGAWGCFDDFNRINISVLSVISTQLQSIKNALIKEMKTFPLLFNEKSIDMDGKVGIFITMNACFANNKSLPESVKAFFRPVACNVPDFEYICQILLYSEGFSNAKIISKKITVLFKIAENQLSKQSHYDWSLRNLISVLRMAGKFKRNSPNSSESSILIRALRDSNEPKFIHEDITLFSELVKDLFPGEEYYKNKCPEFVEAVKCVLLKNDYIIIEFQVDKIIQIHETISNRHSTMLVGSTGVGKSVMIQTFINVQLHMGIPTKLIFLNPKAFNVSELYGVFDPITGDWKDGLYSSILRKINYFTENHTKYFTLFDGDIDPIWVENINSVMDDNKVLTLANGERIKLASHCSLLFEVGNLYYASPATVSRTGIIYINSNKIEYLSYWKKWINTSDFISEKNHLNYLFDLLIPDAMNFINNRNDIKIILPQIPIHFVLQLTSIIESVIKWHKNKTYDKNILQCIFISAIYCSFGSLITSESRNIFDDFIKKKSQMSLVDDDINNKASKENLPKKFPTLYDYHFNIDNECWDAWEWLVPKYIHDRSLNFFDNLVPTIDTIRIYWLIKILESNNKPFLLIGDTGASKTTIIKKFFKNKYCVNHIVMMMNFSSNTSSKDLQKNIESSIKKRTKDIYGPPLGKKLVIFIDDMNMPQVDDYGTQQPIALLKSIIEKNGLYTRENDIRWINLKDVTYIAAMGKTGGCRNEVDPRFLTKFFIHNLIFPSEITLKYIYSSLLEGHLQIFSYDIQSIGSKLIEMTLDLFKKILTDLLPTPSKFHYIFNMRDLSRIISGLYLTRPALFPEPKYFIRVWRNEFCRVICDRLICNEDHLLVQDYIISIVGRYFSEDSVVDSQELSNGDEVDQVQESGTPAMASDNEAVTETGYGEMSDEGLEEELAFDKPKELTVEEYVLRDPILFGDYRNSLNNENRYYEDLLDYDAIYYLFQEILEEYNESSDRLPMILFEDCLENLTRVHRIIRMERGHMLLVGTESSGKKSIVKLATFAANAVLFEISTGQKYNEFSFKADLKRLFNVVGLENKNCVFLLSSEQIVNEVFLEYINDILIDGISASLFSEVEKNDIINILQNDAKSVAYNQSIEKTWDYFCETCAKNIHIIFVTTSDNKLKKNCRNYPSLINNTTINWIHTWPKEALFAIANIFLVDVAHIPEQFKEKIVQHITEVHYDSIAHTIEYSERIKKFNHITPKHYINFINNYLKQIDDKYNFITAKCKQLDSGLLKIEETNVDLQNLNSKLIHQRNELSEKLKYIETIQNEIRKAENDLEEFERMISEKNVQLLKKYDEMLFEKNIHEKVLSNTLPALESAQLELNSLNETDLSEIRSLDDPPEIIQIVCECILILYDIKELSWKFVKDFIDDSHFIQKLLELDYNQIDHQKIESVKTHLEKSENIHSIKNISKFGHRLLNYVLAILNYCTSNIEIKPKMDRLQTFEEDIAHEEAEIDSLKIKMNNMKDHHDILHDDYENTLKIREKIQTDTDVMAKQLLAAEKLMSSFSIEQDRWREDLKILQYDRSGLIGNCLISAAFLTYLGPFTFEYRMKMLNIWITSLLQKNIPLSVPHKLEKDLSNNTEISRWISCGLPSDELSIQNGILTMYATHYPVFIDPQMQAFKWIKIIENKNDLIVSSLSAIDYVDKLKIAIKLGRPILIQDADYNIDAVLNNILEKNIKRDEKFQFIYIGQEKIDFNENFRLYLCTKLSNPKFNLNVYGKTTVINFSITLSALEEQLLCTVIQNEHPDLEEQHKNLNQNLFECKKTLEILEKLVLCEFSSFLGSIYSNDTLVSALESAKENITSVSNKLALASTAALNINHLRNDYKPMAVLGAKLFFILLDMASVDNMYQYSLDSYLIIFELSLKNTPIVNNIQIRAEIFSEILIDNFHDFVYIGLYECHKLLFSFLITICIEKYRGNVFQNQIDFLVKEFTSKHSELTSPVSWFPENCWNNLNSLKELFPNLFNTIVNSLIEYSNEWKNWYESNIPEVTSIPNCFLEKIEAFEYLIFLKCIRTDILHSAIRDYIKSVVGAKLITPPVQSLEQLYCKYTSWNSFIIILSTGCNPSSELIKFAQKHKICRDNMKILSLGQECEAFAMDLLNTSMTNGYWILFENCHLVPKFLIELSRKIENFENSHNNFKLWLTTIPNSSFPISMLQRSIKVIVQPPNGLKSNLRKTFNSLDDTKLNDCIHPYYKKLIYVIAFFHAVVQERRKYNKSGWNICYDFNEFDIDACLDILKCYLEKKNSKHEKISWDVLKCLFGEVIYGGHVIDFYDKRIIKTYMNEYFGDFLFDTFEPFYFYRTSDIEYCILSDSNNSGYIKMIDELSSIDKPEVYGLHPNSEINYYSNEITSLLKYVSTIQSCSENTYIELSSKEDAIKTKVLDILHKIPSEFNIEKIKQQFEMKITPSFIVLLQELQRFNELTRIISKTLNLLIKALNGQVGMNSLLENIFTSLCNEKIPNEWKKFMPATCKSLGDWLNHYIARSEQYRSWAMKEEPIVIWLSGLHVPKSYLVAHIQMACHLYGWSLDNATQFTEITPYINIDEVEQRPESGCYVYGLYLEGAQWDPIENCLKKSHPKVLVTELPIIYVKPIESKKMNLLNTFTIPVYTTSSRADEEGNRFVFETYLRSFEDSSHWILQGICILLNKD